MTPNTSESSLSGRHGQATAVFDPAALVQRCAGDQELATELAALFVHNVDTMLAAVASALGKRDAVALERAAHALKGMTANFGPTTAVSLAGEMEGLAKGGQIDSAEQIQPTLTEAIEALRQALQRDFRC